MPDQKSTCTTSDSVVSNLPYAREQNIDGLLTPAAIAAVFTLLFGMRSERLGTRHEIPDRLYWYSPDDVQRMLADWGESGKHWYISTQVALDFIFPVIYGWMFCTLLSFLLPRSTGAQAGDPAPVRRVCGGRFADRILRGLRILGFGTTALMVLSDWLENSLLILHFKNSLKWSDDALVTWASVATNVKWLALCVVGIIFVVGCVDRIYGSIRSKQIFVALNNWIQLFILQRYPLCALLVLTCWAYVACCVPGIQSIAGNMLLVESFWQISLMACVNALAIIFSISMVRAVKHFYEVNSRGRKDYRTTSWRWHHYLLVLFLSLVTPLASYHFSLLEQSIEEPTLPAEGYGKATLFIGGGVFAALVAMLVFGYLVGWTIGQQKGDSNFFPAEDRNQKAMISWMDLGRNHASHFSWQMIFYFLLLSILFFVIFNWYERKLTWLSIPAYVIMLVWLISMVLTRLSIWLDTLRIPTILILVVIVALARCFDTPHSLPVIPLETSSSTIYERLKKFRDTEDSMNRAVEPLVTAEEQARHEVPASAEKSEELMERISEAERKLTDARMAHEHARRELQSLAWQVISNRMQRVTSAGKEKTLVIVTCPGGGIHAAAWSAHVLEQLDKRYSDFSDSVCLISGVSGGSVGTLFHALSRYVESTDSSQPLDGMQWYRPSGSCLGAIAAGLAFNDMPSVFCPWWPIPGLPDQDRGLRLENEWKSRFKESVDLQTLDGWGERALQGKMPAIVFNATDAVSGRRILFSSVPTPPRLSLSGRVGRPWDHRELINYTKYDMHVTTAARASATFPYVTPFTVPNEASNIGREVAIGDGGYADNEGIVTAIDWLDFIGREAAFQKKRGGNVPFKRILMLRIQPTSDAEFTNADSAMTPSLQSQMRWLTGPLEALASMRTSSQVERGQLEADLASAYIDTPWWKESAEQSAGRASDAPPTPGAPPADNLANNPATDSLDRANASQPMPDREASLASVQGEDAEQLPFQAKINAAAVETQLRMRYSVDVKLKQPTAPESSSEQQTPPENELKIESQFYVGEELEELEMPVIMATISYQHPDPNAPIPLNWKLSPKQLTWYPKAWGILIEAATGTTRDEAPTVIQVLNRFFEPRPLENSKSEISL